MNIYVSILIYSLLIISTIQNDTLFYNKFIKDFFFPKTKKYWTAYINRLLSETVQRHVYPGRTLPSNIENTLLIIYRFTEMFSLRTRIRFKRSIISQIGSPPPTTLTTPTGKVMVHGDGVPEGVLKWKYSLSPFLRINFTVEHMYMSTHSMMSCSSYLQLKDEERTLKYCGILSLIVIYHSGQQPEGQILVNLFVIYNITMHYTIMDPNPQINMWTHGNDPARQFIKAISQGMTVITYHKNMSKTSQMDPTASTREIFKKFPFSLRQLQYFIKKTAAPNVESFTNENDPIANPRYILELEIGFAVLSFHIKVKKTEALELRVNRRNDLGEIFDGPGILSPKVNKNKFISDIELSIYKASTFQVFCFVKLNISGTLKLQFTSKRLNTQQLKTYKNINISYPLDTICNHTFFCILTLFSNPGTFIKLEIKQFVFKGHLSSDCVFGGYFAYDQLLDKHSYIAHDCITQDENYFHRNIYSKTNRLKLVLFYYHGYTDFLKISMLLGIARCQRVSMNTCKVPNFDVALNTTKDCLIVQPFVSSMNKGICSTNIYPEIKRTVMEKSTVTVQVKGFIKVFHRKNVSHARKYKSMKESKYI